MRLLVYWFCHSSCSGTFLNFAKSLLPESSNFPSHFNAFQMSVFLSSVCNYFLLFDYRFCGPSRSTSSRWQFCPSFSWCPRPARLRASPLTICLPSACTEPSTCSTGSTATGLRITTTSLLS
jgi:hypothetical protein